MAVVYQHLDADRKEIRVLVLEAGQKSYGDVLHCHLKHISLNDESKDGLNNAYETISYCWGDASALSTIQVNSIMTQVPRNTELALRSMWLSDQTRVLWIDAICINQGDLKERSQQVAIMADVYREATGNLVYLGEPDEYTESALHSIDLLMQTEIADATSIGRSLIDTLYCRQGNNLGPVWATTGLTVPIDQYALNLFYQRPWFRRLWVIQEVAMAKASTGTCGHHSFDMLHVLMVAKWLQYKYSSLDSDLRMTVYAPAKIFNFTDERHSILRTFDVNLLHVMECAREFEYTEPLDIVYAVTGLVNWRERTISGTLPTRLRPDYSRPFAQLLTSAAHIIIFSQSSLQLLDEIAHRSVPDMLLDGLPSWVPRWHRKRDSITDSAPFQLFDASAGTPWMLPEMDKAFDTDLPGQVTVDGYQLDTITQVFPPKQHFTWSKFYDDFVAPAKQIEARTRSSSQSVVHTLTAGSWSDGTPINLDQLNICQEICSQLAEASNELPELSIADGPAHGPLDDRTRLLLEGKQAMLNACNRRMMCQTESELLCLVPDIAEAGDRVVLLFGGGRPFVLRPVDGQYQVVGACYIYGKMHGEAVDEWKEEGSLERIFTLV